jgi:hypothetical protein
MSIDVSITVATSGDAPVAIFGEAVSAGVWQLLNKDGSLTVTSANCEAPGPGRVFLNPGSRHLHADQIVTWPKFVSPSAQGDPGAPRGFIIPVGVHCKVRGLKRVYAASDATDSPVKHVGIAVQRADVGAQGIAALARVADGDQQNVDVVTPMQIAVKYFAPMWRDATRLAVVAIVIAHVLLVRRHGIVPPFQLPDRGALPASASEADSEPVLTPELSVGNEGDPDTVPGEAPR